MRRPEVPKPEPRCHRCRRLTVDHDPHCLSVTCPWKRCGSHVIDRSGLHSILALPLPPVDGGKAGAQ